MGPRDTLELDYVAFGIFCASTLGGSFDFDPSQGFGSGTVWDFMDPPESGWYSHFRIFYLQFIFLRISLIRQTIWVHYAHIGLIATIRSTKINA